MPPTPAPQLLPYHEALLEWYERHQREFYWREPGAGAYTILLAEVLLQRTPADRVEPVLQQLLVQYPSPSALARAPLGDLETFLRPLGLYRRRSKALHRLAVEIEEEHEGRIPRTYDALARIKGVGDYIARAVRCFAFAYLEPVVDVNVIRIFSRAFSVVVKDPAKDPRRNPHILTFAREMLPPGRHTVRRYNWALLDLGALVCHAGEPECGKCPLEFLCDHAGPET